MLFTLPVFQVQSSKVTLAKGASSQLLFLLICQTEIGKMDEVYQISSTEKVQQLEQELAAQLAELKAEIEDKKILRGTTNRAYR